MDFSREAPRWPGRFSDSFLPPESIPEVKPLQVETELFLELLAERRPAEAVGHESYPPSFWRDAAEFTVGMLSSIYRRASRVPRWASHVVTDWAVSQAPYRENAQSCLQAWLNSSGDEIYKDIYPELLGAIVFWTLDLPASESHHHSYRFGFLDHTLEVVLGALLEMRRAWGDRPFGPEEGSLLRWAHEIAAAALLHDVGKIFDVEVQDPASGEIWDPLKEPLVLFKYRHETDLFRPTEFRFRSKRALREHECAGRKFVSRLLPTSASEGIGVIFAQAIDAYFSRYDRPRRKLVDPLDQMAEFVHRADCSSAAAWEKTKNRPGAYLSRLVSEAMEGPTA